MSVIQKILADEIVNNVIFSDIYNTVCIEFNSDIDKQIIDSLFINQCESIGRCNNGNWGVIIIKGDLDEEDMEALKDYASKHQPIGNIEENRNRINRDCLPKTFK